MRAEDLLEEYAVLVYDAEHWNSVNQEEEPIVIEPIDLDETKAAEIKSAVRQGNPHGWRLAEGFSSLEETIRELRDTLCGGGGDVTQ